MVKGKAALYRLTRSHSSGEVPLADLWPWPPSKDQVPQLRNEGRVFAFIGILSGLCSQLGTDVHLHDSVTLSIGNTVATD